MSLYLGSNEVAVTKNVETGSGATEYTFVGAQHPATFTPFFDVSSLLSSYTMNEIFSNSVVWIELSADIYPEIWLDDMGDDTQSVVISSVQKLFCNFYEPTSGSSPSNAFFTFTYGDTGFFVCQCSTGEKEIVVAAFGDDPNMGWSGTMGWSETLNGGLSMSGVTASNLILHILMFN